MANDLPVTSAVRWAGLLAFVEAALLVVYCVVLAVASINSTGVRESAPIAEIVIYLLFALGIGAVGRATLRGNSAARPPFFLTQIFVVIIGITVFAGDGATVKVVGAVVVALGVIAGLAGAAAIRSQEPPG